MDRQAILDRLSAEAPDLRAGYGAKSQAVFGSMARGDDCEGSDVDILVTIEGRATLDNVMGLKLDLEERVGRTVDLLTPKCLVPEMEARIESKRTAPAPPRARAEPEAADTGSPRAAPPGPEPSQRMSVSGPARRGTAPILPGSAATGRVRCIAG